MTLLELVMEWVVFPLGCGGTFLIARHQGMDFGWAALVGIIGGFGSQITIAIALRFVDKRFTKRPPKNSQL
jgi:hypothetical protein